MLAVYKVLILFNFNVLFIEGLLSGWPELHVVNLEPKLIERKRQDTLDMCRIFNEENDNILTTEKGFNGGIANITTEFIKNRENVALHRAKRDAEPLQVDDALRVENIVDKIYDDIFEKGGNVTYRRKIPGLNTNLNTDKKSNKKSGRRFNFAPRNLTYGQPLNKHTDIVDLPDTTQITPRFKQGIVPYFIDTKTYDGLLSKNITRAFEHLEKMSCIRLEKLRTRPTDLKSLSDVLWVYITNPSGVRQCVHSNDRADIHGVQMIVFGYDCMSMGDILHEMMHVLGFSHEHLRPDRDQHVTIMWDNIKPGYRRFFETIPNPVIGNLPYDYDSVLHYPPRAFSRNGQATIKTKPGVRIGQRERLSETDIEKINALYAGECSKREREYLRQTCPSVVQSDSVIRDPPQVAMADIEKYFQNRIWPYAVVNFKLRSTVEFSKEELLNIHAVINHIEKETDCIEFRYLGIGNNSHDDTFSKDKENLAGGDKGSSSSSGSSEDDSGEPEPEQPQPNDERIKSHSDSSSHSSSIEPYVQLNDPDPTALNSSLLVTNEKDQTNTAADAESPAETIEGKMAPADNIGEETKINEKDLDQPESLPDLSSNKIDGDEDVSKKKPSLMKFLRRKPKTVRKKRSLYPSMPPSPQRRHATNVIVLSRSSSPGCNCPEPGKPKGIENLYINGDCFNSMNDLLHLFVHVLGLEHQHNMHDRDSFLHIVWDQLTSDTATEMKNKLSPAASVGFPYDYQSVMHYPWIHIKNGKTNIMYPIWNDGWAMGQSEGLSATDISKLNIIYWKQCGKRKNEALKVKQSNTDQIL